MSTGAAPKETLSFTPDQKHVLASTAPATQFVAGLLLLLGIIGLAGGPVGLIWLGKGLMSSLLLFVQGGLTVLLGLVMLAVSSDFKFLEHFPQYSGNHFRNAAKNLTFFYQIQLALAIVIGLLALVRWLA